MKIDSLFNRNTIILIVDDNYKNLQILGSLLKESNYQIAAAKDGESALKLAEKLNPDLVLLDVMMPGLSGFETCAKLKSIENLRNIPVIFLSARNESEDIVKGFTVGGVDYVTKPFVKEELLARIRNHLIIRHTERELKELIVEKDKFFSIIAHDLKNPITSLVGLVNILNENIDKYDLSRIKKLVNGISDSAMAQYKLQENLLEWSRIQTGNIRVNLESFNLYQAITGAIESSNSSLITKNIEIKYIGNKEIIVLADKIMIDSVLRNLISNAVKFSFNDSTITLKTENIENYVHISVMDNGVGIGNEYKENIFKINSISLQGTHKEKGTGLGLVVCKEFVEKNDGTIHFKSEEGQGTVFTFTVPLDK